MATEVSSVNTEMDTVDLQKYEWVTVREALIREGISEKQVYNRINDGYYRATVIKGKKHVLLQKLQNPPVITSEVNSESTETISEPLQKTTVDITEYLLKQAEKLTEEITTLKAKLEASEARANQAERMAARLEGEISRVDETLKAKDQAINAANAAVLIYEQHKAPAALESKQESQEAPKPKGLLSWFKR